MRNIRWNAKLLLAALLIFPSACTRTPSARGRAAPLATQAAAATQPASPTTRMNLPDEGVIYYGCDEAIADAVITMEFSIEGYGLTYADLPVKHLWVNEFPTFAESGFAATGDGVSKDGLRGIGVTLSVFPFDDDESGVILQVNVLWTADDGTYGRLKKMVSVPVGVTSERQLSPTVRLKTSFREPDVVRAKR